MTTINWEDLRKNYPVTENLVYFNNASMGPIPTNIRDVWETFLREWNTEDITGRFNVDTWEPLRAKVAKFVGARTEEIAFCQSTSEGIVRAVESIEFASSDNVVIPWNEFPSNVIPWKQLEQQGVEIRFARGRHFYVTEDDIMECCDEDTRVIAASAVSFASGYRLDLGAIAEYCHDRDMYFFSDIIQGSGSMDINLNHTKVDMAAFQAVKWIPSSSGTGVFFCSRDILPELKVNHIGWLSVERNGLEDLLDFDLKPFDTARRYDCGTSNLLGMIGLNAAMDYYLGIGMENIESRILYLVDIIIKGLENLGHNIVSCTDAAKRSGIVVFEVPDAEGLVKKLRENHIIVAVRNGRIRLSPHFYNNENDVEKFLRALR